jgi:hypothetical protein
MPRRELLPSDESESLEFRQQLLLDHLLRTGAADSGLILRSSRDMLNQHTSLTLGLLGHDGGFTNERTGLSGSRFDMNHLGRSATSLLGPEQHSNILAASMSHQPHQQNFSYMRRNLHDMG